MSLQNIPTLGISGLYKYQLLNWSKLSSFTGAKGKLNVYKIIDIFNMLICKSIVNKKLF